MAVKSPPSQQTYILVCVFKTVRTSFPNHTSSRTVSHFKSGNPNHLDLSFRSFLYLIFLIPKMYYFFGNFEHGVGHNFVFTAFLFSCVKKIYAILVGCLSDDKMNQWRSWKLLRHKVKSCSWLDIHDIIQTRMGERALRYAIILPWGRLFWRPHLLLIIKAKR